jgi:hypothetical protein
LPGTFGLKVDSGLKSKDFTPSDVTPQPRGLGGGGYKQLVEVETGETWERMREELEGLRLVTLSAKEGTAELTPEPTAAQRKILGALSIPPPKRMRRVELASPSL